MKTNRIYLSFILICCVTLLYAYPVETVVLQDGSVLEGYMSVQRPGKDIVFVAQKATIYVPSDKVVSIVRHETEVDKLSEQWKEWKNPQNWDIALPNGEHKVDALNRVMKVLDKLCLEPYQVMGVAIHKGTMTNILAKLGYVDWEIPNCGVLHLVNENGVWRVEESIF